MQLQGLAAALLGALTVALAGCGQPESAPASVAGGNSAATAEPPVAAGEATPRAQDISLKIARREDYDALIAAHSGKIVVVDFWATWCGPCVEQFPHTVAMSRKFDPASVAVVSVSMDEPSDQEDVRAFLQDAGAAFDNLLSQYGVSQEGFEAFEITDGALPHYKVYDRAGTLRRATGGNEGLEQLIQRLLEEG